MPDDVGQVTSEHIRAFLVTETEGSGWNPARGQGGETSVPDVVKPFFTEAEITALLRACIGQDFESRLDAAIIRILVDTGPGPGDPAGRATLRDGRSAARPTAS